MTSELYFLTPKTVKNVNPMYGSCNVWLKKNILVSSIIYEEMATSLFLFLMIRDPWIHFREKNCIPA